MAKHVISILLVVVAVIHLLPVIGVTGGTQIGALYGVDIRDQNLEILMRHRAVLFAMLGLFLLYAAFKPSVQPVAFIAAATSILTFLGLAYAVGEFNQSIQRVVIADWIALICLVVAVMLHLWLRSRTATR